MIYWLDWSGYPSKRLYVKRTGHETHDKIATITGRHLASRAIKQLNEHITTAVLNTGRRYNT